MPSLLHARGRDVNRHKGGVVSEGKPTKDNTKREEDRAFYERFELLDHVQSLLEPAMALLGLVFLGLLLLDYGAFEVAFLSQSTVDTALQLIWVAFIIDFATRLIIAPDKVGFLKDNWLTMISLVLPFLRPLRAFRAVRGVRSLRLVRFLGGINRGMRVLRRVARGRQFAYVAVLTVVIMLAGAVGALNFEQGIADAPIQTFGDAVWWSAAMVTTINNEKYAVSPEARTIAILVRIYAVSVFGYITASIATYLIGASSTSTEQQEEKELMRSEITALREELATVRQNLGAYSRSMENDSRDETADSNE